MRPRFPFVRGLPPLLLALLACSAYPASDSTQSSALSPSPNDRAAYDFFVGEGLTSFQAAGIIGNLDQESQTNPDAVEAGGPGRGIAQWSVGGRWDTEASDNVLWYAGTKGQSSKSLTLQLDFVWYELHTFSGYGLKALRATTNVSDATIAFERDFEGCGECDEATRISYAKDALAAYGSPAYGAADGSQSFPLAPKALTMFSGQTIASYIEVKNSGTKAWDTKTHLGTTNPRNRVSAFADTTWLASDRPVGVEGSVAPGESYRFNFDLHAPATPGTYFEYFNVVEEGVAWFSDPGQGGPSDKEFEAQIVVVALDGGSPASAHDDAGVDPRDEGGADAGLSDDAADAPPPMVAEGNDGGTESAGPLSAGPVEAPLAEEPEDAGPAASGASSNGPSSSGPELWCALATGRTTRPGLSWILGLLPIALVARRRFRRVGTAPTRSLP